MKKIQILVASFVLVVMGMFVFMPISSVSAVGALDTVCDEQAIKDQGSAVCANKAKTSDGFIGQLINVLLYVAGAVSVLAIVIGGILYVLSGGNSASVTKAKNTVLYAVIGLIVSFLAFAIINWVVKLFK